MDAKPEQRDSKARRNRTRRKKLSLDQNFQNYLSFGRLSTACLGCFLACYALVIVCLSPMLEAPASSSSQSGPLNGAHLPHAPGKERISEAISAAKEQLRRLRKSSVSDEKLLEDAANTFKLMRAKKHDERPIVPEVNAKNAGVETPGFVVLGMHRSGTSMLSGLLVTSAGYNVGGPLIGAASDNEKGFFERVDIVLQNDEFMKHQNIWWAANVINYDPEKALEHKKTGTAKFVQGKRGLEYLNNPDNTPWLQKDPRMCITLKTWLKLLNKPPAVVFTYRHPLEVALSLKKREQQFTLERGLRLWIVYNMRAIQNSEGLCRVLSSNEAILASPLKEVQRISDELNSKCGVPAPPNRLSEEDVVKFIDPKLQHNKNKRQEEEKQGKVLEDYDGCVVRDYVSDNLEGTPQRERELILYKKAMKIFCDFKSGKAYESSYQWPELP